MRVLLLSMVLCACFAVVPAWAQDSDDFDLPQVPAPGRVTVLELGAAGCPPCDMMKPLIERLKHDLRDVAAVEVIDVWHHPGVATKYGVSSIPTFIVFNAEGREVFRHTGPATYKDIILVVSPLVVQ